MRDWNAFLAYVFTCCWWCWSQSPSEFVFSVFFLSKDP